MNKSELQKLLRDSNVPKDLYSLEGGRPNEAYCLNFENNVWEVYYSERGMKSQLVTFETEEEACGYFHKTILEMLN